MKKANASPTPPSLAAIRRFNRLGAATVVVVYLLILVGGVVRASGAGMGCPDWPKCFGLLIPPTEESQLPANYREQFATESVVVEPFNAVKTWTEYLNRLLGALTGVLIFGTLLASLTYWESKRHIVWISLLAFVLVGFQAWLGKLVVERNLHEGTITIHMIVALVIVALLTYAVSWPRLPRIAQGLNIPIWLPLVVLGADLVQLVLGTQVREAVDVVAKTMGEAGRANWIAQLGGLFSAHRAFSLFVSLLSLLWVVQLWPNRGERLIGWMIGTNLVVLGLAISGGMLLAYVGFPAFAQPLHLLTGALLVGVHLFGLLVVLKGMKAPAVIQTTAVHG